MKCPFIDPKFELDIQEPCPVCGAKGFSPIDVERKCIDAGDKDWSINNDTR